MEQQIHELIDRSKYLAQYGDLKLTIPSCQPGIGSIINSLQSADLIADVRVRKVDLWPDDRGFFMEINRLGTDLIAEFPPSSIQISAALSYAGTIKAFHYHLHQTDCWTPATGMFQVVLVDLRADSPTFGRKNTMYVGTLRPWQILIPPGVGHGYKVIGEGPATLVYMTDRVYNPKDEGRIAHNDPGITYDWELQHK